MNRSADTVAALIGAQVIRRWLERRLENALGRGDRESAALWGEALAAFDRACATLRSGGTT